MEFKGGAGSFTLDFDGNLRSDGSVSISAGVGSVHIIVPSTTAAEVVVKGNLTNITHEGGWTTEGKTYQTPAAGAKTQGKLLTITVNMNLGNLSLTTNAVSRMSDGAGGQAIWLEGVRIRGDEFPDRAVYPFNVPAFQQRQELRLHRERGLPCGRERIGKVDADRGDRTALRFSHLGTAEEEPRGSRSAIAAAGELPGVGAQ